MSIYKMKVCLFFRKIQIVNLNFWGKKQWFFEIFKGQIKLHNLNFRAKNREYFCKDRLNNNWKLVNFDNFWRENSNSYHYGSLIFTNSSVNFWQFCLKSCITLHFVAKKKQSHYKIIAVFHFLNRSWRGNNNNKNEI